MLPLISAMVLLVVFLVLLRFDLVESEIVSPFFVGIILLTLLSQMPGFIEWVGEKTGILYSPLSVLLIIILIIVLAITALAVGYTKTYRRQQRIIVMLAQLDLDKQEEDMGSRDI